MRTIAIRTLASILAALLTFSCGTVRENRYPGIEERVFLPRAPRAVASPVVDELELRRAIEELLPYVNVEEARAELRRMVADPRFHGRQPGELRVALASWGSGPVALEQIGREYRAWCAAAHRTHCHEGPLTGSSIFMATIAIPELVSKIPAAAATVVLTAYLGAQAVCDLVFGWIQMVRELDAATTFNEVRAAGQHYGRLVGAQTARVLILLATAAIAQGGLIARLMKLPRATQASAALAAETGGVGLEAVGAVKGARVLQGAVAVAMAAHGAPPPSGAAKTFEVRKYKDMPRPRPAETEAHHGMISKWMEKHFPKYQPGEAPAVLMGRRAHDSTRAVFGKWRAMMREKMGGNFDWGKVSETEIRDLSEKLFDAAGVPQGVRLEFWKQFEQYKASLSN